MEDLGAIFDENAGLGSNESVFEEFLKAMIGKDANHAAGSAFQAILESSELFSEVNVRKIILPVSRCDEAQIGELYPQKSPMMGWCIYVLLDRHWNPPYY